ncbi:MAG: ATP-binding protein [Solirubrobacteraceae bacterium]|nr:ATP-binding protein [Patulibacter sp.]
MIRVLSGRPLRVRLTVAFASVMALVLATVGLLIFVKFRSDFGVRTDRELQERSATIQRLAGEDRSPASVVALAGEVYVQVYDARGKVLASSELLRHGWLLNATIVRRALHDPVVGESIVPGSGEGARIRAFPIGGDRVAVIGEPLHERVEELRGLALLLGLGLPATLLLASGAGYLVAKSALRPVERMQAEAASIGAGDLCRRLPEPGTSDELDHLATTLNDLLDRLANALERERRMVGDASHELRTPISLLGMRIEVALQRPDDLDTLRAALESAQGDVRRLGRLADDLLLLARADQGEVPLRLGAIDAREVVDGTIDHAVAIGLVDRDRIDVRVPAAGGPVLHADPERAQQVLLNLVANAVRHGAGTVVIDAHGTAAGEVELTVCDDGPGVPEAFLPRAFERFSQATVSGEGAGLGLAISDALMQAQGGRVTLANRDGGRGAVATLVFTAP